MRSYNTIFHVKSMKELVVRDEERNPPCDLGFECAAEVEEVVSLPSSFVKFSSGLGVPIVGFEKEISSLLKKLQSRKESGVNGLGGKKKILLSSCFERKIRKLECSINYNSSLSTVRGKGRGFKEGVGVGLRKLLCPVGVSSLGCIP